MRRRALAVVALLALLGFGGQAAARKSSTKPTRTPAAHANANAKPATYTVVNGDNLSKIATRFGTTVADLRRANNLKANRVLRIGTVLKIPVAPPAPGTRGLPDKLRRSPERLALMPLFDQAAKRHKVPADLLKAVAWQESGWQNDKVSSTKALGIGQLMPDTVAFVNGVLLRKNLDPRKPADNIAISARYLAWLLAQTKGDVNTALAGYYQGLASVRRQGPLPETEVYVNNVLHLRARF